MMNYSYDQDEKKTFILGYKIKKGMIIVKYAGRLKDKIPYNEGNEQIVLDKMRDQVLKIKEEKFVSNKRKNIIFDFTMGGALAIASAALFYISINNGMVLPANVFGSLFAVGGTFLIANGSVLNDILRDYQKNLNFIKMEEELNEKVRKNDNILVNTSNKTRNMVKSAKEDSPVFNINSFNNIPNKDLEQIMDNIDRDEYFNYEYNKPSKGKTKKKTR